MNLLDFFSSPSSSNRRKYEEIALWAIHAESDFNSRSNLPNIQKLAENIKEVGLLAPILVRREEEKYEVVAGFRRFAAVSFLHWEFVPTFVLDVSKEEARLINLAENVERESLRLYDLMRTIAELSHSGLKAKKIEKDTGVREQKIYRLTKIWFRLCDWVKDRWSQIEDPAWEPSLLFLERISLFSTSEQKKKWNEWARTEEIPNEIEEEKKEGKRETKRGRRRIKEVREMILVLGNSQWDQAQRRALQWAIGKRGTL